MGETGYKNPGISADADVYQIGTPEYDVKVREMREEFVRNSVITECIKSTSGDACVPCSMFGRCFVAGRPKAELTTRKSLHVLSREDVAQNRWPLPNPAEYFPPPYVVR